MLTARLKSAMAFNSLATLHVPYLHLYLGTCRGRCFEAHAEYEVRSPPVPQLVLAHALLLYRPDFVFNKLECVGCKISAVYSTPCRGSNQAHGHHLGLLLSFYGQRCDLRKRSSLIDALVQDDPLYASSPGRILSGVIRSSYWD